MQGQRAAQSETQEETWLPWKLSFWHVPSQIQGTDVFSTRHTSHLQKDNGRCGSYSMCKNRLQMDLRCKWKYLNHKSTRRKHRRFLCTLGIERTYLSVIKFWIYFVIVVALLFFLCLAKQFRLLSDLFSSYHSLPSTKTRGMSHIPSFLDTNFYKD